MNTDKTILEQLEDTEKNLGDLDEIIKKALDETSAQSSDFEKVEEGGVTGQIANNEDYSDTTEYALTCPDCGGGLTDSPEGPFCPNCALKHIRAKMGTLTKAMDRIKGLCGVYFKMLQTGEAFPNRTPDDLVSMLPTCLTGVDLVLEKERIQSKTSTLSAQQREYLKYFFDAQQLCQLLLDRKTEEEKQKDSSEDEVEFTPMEEGETLPIVEQKNTASTEAVVANDDSIGIEEHVNDIESQPLSF